MSAVSAKSRKQTISSFLDALDRHDVEVMMSHMSDECVFETASGRRYLGSGIWGERMFAQVTHRSGKTCRTLIG